MGYRPVYARMSGVGRKGVVVLMLVGFGCVILSALFFGSLGPAERVAFQYGVTPAGVSLARAVVGALVIGSYALFRDPAALVPGLRDSWKFALAGLFGVVFVYYLSNIAFVTIPVGLTVILFYTNPIWTALGAAAMGKEPFTRARVAALVAGLAGVWIAVGGTGGAKVGELDMTGVALAVVSGAGFSFYILNSRYGTGREMPFKTFVQMFLWGSLMMLAIVLYSKEMPDFRNLPRPALLSLVHLALFPTLASYGLISFALKYIPGTAASITSMSEIIFAGVMAWAFLGEVPSPDQVRGGLLIVTAVLLLLMEGRISRSGTQGEKRGTPPERSPGP